MISMGLFVALLGEARDEMASARRLVAATGNGNPVVRHGFVSLEDHIGFDVGVLRARHTVAFASDEFAIEAHRGRGGDYHAAVVGGIV